MTAKLFPDVRHYEAAVNALLKPEALRQTRIDCALIVLIYRASAVAYGAHWYLLALMVFGRGAIISLMDNAYHYGTPADNSVAAKELKTPALLSAFVLNFNHHMTHHHHARLPWTALKRQHADNGGAYSQGMFAAIGEQFKGPVQATIPDSKTGG